MAQWPNPYQAGRTSPWEGAGTWNPAIGRFFNAVYAWMCVGLLVTAGVAWYVSQHADLLMALGRGVWVLFIVQIVLVMVIAGAVNRINAAVATVLFLIYAASNGFVLSAIFLVYAKSTITTAFLITAGTFGAMSVYGFFTKADLTRVGQIAFMGLIGIIIASIVSFFWHNTMLEVAINYIGVLVFVGLTAYDTQKLKQIAAQTAEVPAMAARYAIVGSLTLYLDFINLFLFILSIMGDRRR